MSAYQSFQPIQSINAKSNGSFNIDADSSGLSGNRSPFLEDEVTGKSLTFQNLFSQAVNGVNDSLMHAGDLGRKVMTGEVKNLHEVSIAGVKAEIMLKLATQVTSKVTQAATQLFQMQI